MAGTQRAVTADTLGAWLIKARPSLTTVEQLVGPGVRDVTHRCVRANYRTGLVEPGQPVLVWVSGGHADVPAGVHAQGRTTGIPTYDASDSRGPGLLDLPVRLQPLARPVLREELLAHPSLSRIEVLRMPAGSNPSFLTLVELDELRSQWPQVTVGPGEAC